MIINLKEGIKGKKPELLVSLSTVSAESTIRRNVVSVHL